jgi:multicomponent Na+:H+ antiporter subunit F
VSVDGLALLGIVVAFLAAVVRVVVGPTRADRVLAADLAFYCVVAGAALLAVRTGSDVLVDVSLVATLVGFLAAVALSRLVVKTKR